MESPFATLIFPQSRTYNRSDFGGAGLCVCARQKGKAAKVATADASAKRMLRRIMLERISSPQSDAKPGFWFAGALGWNRISDGS